MAMTQIQGRKPPTQIVVAGQSFTLKKEATDSTISFPYERLVFINAGCDPIAASTHCCWIYGIIPPAQGSMERPVAVFAIGFSREKRIMSPQFLTREDMSRMHYYTTDVGTFAQEFVQRFLGIAPASENASGPIMPWPEEEQIMTTKPAPAGPGSLNNTNVNGASHANSSNGIEPKGRADSPTI